MWPGCLFHPAVESTQGTLLDWPSSFVFVFFFFVFVEPHPQHVEVPRLGVKSELWPPAYTAATATSDLSRVCNLHHSSRQRQILNPLSRARVPTCILMGPRQIRFHEATPDLASIY